MNITKRFSIEGCCMPDNAIEYIARLQFEVDKIPQEYRGSADIEFECGEGYVDTIEITYRRPETDGEKASRKSLEREIHDRETQREMAELKRLTGKYSIYITIN